MKSLLAVLILWVAFSAEAHKHRHQGAHQHGAGKLAIAFEGADGKMDFKIPSESIFGFEHEGKSAKQKATKQAGIATLEQKMSSMVVFDQALQCVISTDKVWVQKEKGSSHSDTIGAYSVKCAKSPASTSITFNFQSEFPKIKNLVVEIVADNLQKSVEVKKNGTVLELK